MPTLIDPWNNLRTISMKLKKAHGLFKRFTVVKYLYIWTYLVSQSKSHYKMVDRTAGYVQLRGDLCKLFDWETFINKQKG